MTNWIKCTPDTMPPEHTTVMVTVQYGGKREVYPMAKYFLPEGEHKAEWEYVDDDWGEWHPLAASNVLYWAHIPEPAVD